MKSTRENGNAKGMEEKTEVEQRRSFIEFKHNEE